MKRLFASIFTLGLLIGQLPMSTFVAHAETGSYEEAIEYLREHDIAEGYSDGSFRPEQPINRAELSKIIMNAAEDHGEMHGAFCFRDVTNQWFAPYVCTARDHGMVSGYNDGTFRPENTITFAETSSLVAKAYHGDIGGIGGDPASSHYAVAEWYTPYIRTLDEWGAVPPTVRGVHAPLTRGEMAYVIMMAERMSDDEEDEEEAEDEEDEDDEDDYEDDEDVDLDLSVRTARLDVSAGDEVEINIEIENDGDDHEFDLSVTLDQNVSFVDASDEDEVFDSIVLWEDISLDEGDGERFEIVAKVREDVRVGDVLTIEVEADEEEESIQLVVTEAGYRQPPSPVGDPVLYWNSVLLQANADDHTLLYGPAEHGGPTWSTRAKAMVHAAIYEAVNSIDRGHHPYITYVPVGSTERVNMDSAVAAAAYRTLIALHPLQRPNFDRAYEDHLRLIPDGIEKARGLTVGEAAARQVLAAREHDGSKTEFDHVSSNEPGRHRPDPLNPEQKYLGAKWGIVKPFVIRSGTQFRAPAPPSLDSAAYAEAFNEVKTLGGDGITTPTTRTQDQTEIGLFWAYDGVKKIGTPDRLYNQMARVIARQKGNTVVENARLFALINLAMADAGISAWESKYYHDMWRPVVGIREADAGTGPTGKGDNNPLTQGDVNWTPLGAPMSNMTANGFTPPFPAYPSGHATFGTALFKVIERFYGTNDIAFTFTSDELNGATTDSNGVPRRLAPRHFDNLQEAMQENLDSRIYLGVHWRFDQDAGRDMGYRIADYVFENALRPVR